MATVNSGGVTYTSNSKTPYVDIYKQYAKNQQNQINKYREGQATQRSADLDKINSAYDSNAKQYYLQNMQTQRGLNSQLAAQGINGGASESAMLRMANAYGQNIAKNETGRQGDLTSTNQTYDTNMANYLAEQEANRMNMYTTMMQNQAEYDEKRKDKDLQNYAASIADRFNSDSAWKKYIKSLKSKKGIMNYKQKVALAQQAYTRWKMNQQEKSSSGGGGGGYSYGGGGYGGYSGYGDTTTETETKPKTSKPKKTKSGKGGGKSSTSKPSLGQYYTGDWSRFYK